MVGDFIATLVLRPQEDARAGAAKRPREPRATPRSSPRSKASGPERERIIDAADGVDDRPRRPRDRANRRAVPLVQKKAPPIAGPETPTGDHCHADASSRWCTHAAHPAPEWRRAQRDLRLDPRCAVSHERVGPGPHGRVAMIASIAIRHLSASLPSAWRRAQITGGDDSSTIAFGSVGAIFSST